MAGRKIKAYYTTTMINSIEIEVEEGIDKPVWNLSMICDIFSLVGKVRPATIGNLHTWRRKSIEHRSLVIALKYLMPQLHLSVMENVIFS